MLKASDDELIRKFNNLKTDQDIADMLEIKLSSLRFFSSCSAKKYTSFQISKRNGDPRTISAPIPALKTVQKKLLYVLNLVYKPKAVVFGFVRSRNNVMNAQNHIGKKEILTIDLKDFFTQFHFGRVRGMFIRRYNIDSKAAMTLANLVCCNGVLPQGAPTSPIISNMILASFDKSMIAYARKNSLCYSRYADDITLSSNSSKLSFDIVGKVGDKTYIIDNELKSIFEAAKLNINNNKIVLRRNKKRQLVTGVVVNKCTNLTKEYRRELRTILHHWKMKKELCVVAREYIKVHKLDALKKLSDEEVEKWFARVIIGKINYLRDVRGNNPGIFYKYANEANQLFGRTVFDISDIFTADDIAENNVYILENSLGQGTAFVIPELGIMTSYHVVEDDFEELLDEMHQFYSPLSYKTGKVLAEYRVDEATDIYDKTIDFVLIKQDTSTFPNAKRIKLGNSDDLAIGNRVTMIGFPKFHKGTYTKVESTITSIISFHKVPLYEVEYEIRHGFSGGVVLNEVNEVVGIVKAGISEKEAISEERRRNQKYGFVPINLVKNYCGL